MTASEVRANNANRAVAPVCAQTITRILDSLDGIVFVADLESNRILFANRYLKQLFGFDPTGRNCRHLISSHHRADSSFTERMELFNEEGKPKGAIYREYQNPFNKKWYGAKVQAIEWTDGEYARLEIALDITEQRQLKSFVEEARKQADIARDTKNRFVALVAHDLKSPFVSILGMLRRILAKETFSHEIHKTFLENIIHNGQRMLRMIDNLLDMERLEAGSIRPEQSYFDVSAMINEVFDNFSHLALQKKLSLNNLVPPQTEIFADKYLYFVVLNNLISNAIKFSFADGEIEVSWQPSERGSRLIVRDYGKGIPEEYVANIFRADVKTTSKGTQGESGSGLGLLFCQQIMQAHGGRIGLDRPGGGGSIFYVELCPSCKLLAGVAGEDSTLPDSGSTKEPE